MRRDGQDWVWVWTWFPQIEIHFMTGCGLMCPTSALLFCGCFQDILDQWWLSAPVASLHASWFNDSEDVLLEVV